MLCETSQRLVLGKQAQASRALRKEREKEERKREIEGSRERREGVCGVGAGCWTESVRENREVGDGEGTKGTEGEMEIGDSKRENEGIRGSYRE